MRQYEQSGRCKVKLESRSGAIGVRNSLVCTAAINSSVSCSASNVASTLGAMISTELTQVADKPDTVLRCYNIQNLDPIRVFVFSQMFNNYFYIVN